MLAYFLKVNVAIVLFYAFYRLFFYKDTFFRLAQNRTALFLCRFRCRTFAEHTNVDYGAGTDGGHGRSLCQRCATGTHSRHRSGSDRLEKHPFRICQYRLLGNSGIADDTPHHATGRHHPPNMPMPQDTNRQHKYTSTSQSRRAFLFFPLGFLSTRPRIRKRSSTKY